MAKGNLFLGGARGSVGDVTFYTKNGEQISRVRRRSVKNPSTEPQLIQRAVVATIAKAYAAGSAIFDHSFEGVATGAASQARFMQRNIDLLRSQIRNEIEASQGEGQATAVVVERKGSYPVPNAYLISQGSLVQNYLTVGNDKASFDFPVISDDSISVSDYCRLNGLIDDDIFTLVIFGIVQETPAGVNAYKKNLACQFAFVRMRVKTSALTSQSPAPQAKIRDIFDIEATDAAAVSTIGGYDLDGASAPIVAILDSAEFGGAIGCIRSRENSGLRSTSFMSVTTASYGIIGKYIYETWDPLTIELGQSPLILEGGSINVGR